MPLYAWRCPNGHETERFYHMNDVRPQRVRCTTCRMLAKRAITRIQVPAKTPEYFNLSLGERVRSRTHLRELMKEHDCQPYQTLKDRDAIAHDAWKVARDREKYDNEPMDDREAGVVSP